MMLQIPQRLFKILIKLGHYEHVEDILLNALHAAQVADCNEVAARCALRLADHGVRVKNVDNVLSMAEVASLAASKVSVEAGAIVDAPGEHYGIVACSLALAIAPLADSAVRSRIRAPRGRSDGGGPTFAPLTVVSTYK